MKQLTILTLILLGLSACTSPTPTVTNSPFTSTPLPIAATSTPDRTPTSTATAAPPPATETPQATVIDSMDNEVVGLLTYCMPTGGGTGDPNALPNGASLGQLVDGFIEYGIPNKDFDYCLISYQFNNNAPEGLVLELYLIDTDEPFKIVTMEINPAFPDYAFALLEEAWLINVNGTIQVTAVIIDPSTGEEYRVDKIKFQGVYGFPATEVPAEDNSGGGDGGSGPIDTDGDGYPDSEDACPTLGNVYGLGVDGEGCPIDSDSGD